MKRNILFAVFALFVGVSLGLSVWLNSFFYPRQYEKDESGEYVNVNAGKPDTFPITEDTRFVIEHYYPEENRTLKEEISNIPALLGCSREEVVSYLSDYMTRLSVEEREQGLYAFELVSYQGQEIHLRKTYRKPKLNGYIVKSFNGEVVILKSDGKTVFEYTDINIGTLPEDLREEIIKGYRIETEEELYSFLENYSS